LDLSFNKAIFFSYYFLLFKINKVNSDRILLFIKI